MSKITIKINCPHCRGDKVWKNGNKRNGKQNFLCKICGKQFQREYSYSGADPAKQVLIKRMLLRNSGIRDIEAVLEVSRSCVLKNLERNSEQIDVSPEKNHYSSLQIDELWSYVKQRKKNKKWLLYAYSPENDEIVAYATGDRSSRTVKKLYRKIVHLKVDEFCTDDWQAFQKILPADKHKIGKKYTKNIEGVNTCFRARNRRLVRQTTCFSKKEQNHLHAIKLMIAYRNNNYHTF